MWIAQGAPGGARGPWPHWSPPDGDPARLRPCPPPPTVRGGRLPTPEVIPLRIGILAPITWRVPPRRYGPWEHVAGLLAEGLVARGHDVTLFAAGTSETRARLETVCPRPTGEDPSLDPALYLPLHIANAFRRAGEFDLIHNHLNWLPLTYAELVRTPVVTTLHGAAMLEPLSRQAFLRFRDRPYVAISRAEIEAVPELNYAGLVPNGIDLREFPFRPEPDPDPYLLFLGRASPKKGLHLAIELARRAGWRLLIAAHVPPDEQEFFRTRVEPHLDGDRIRYVGEVGGEERARLLGGARALVHLCTVPEPFGLVLAEAQACGTPVIGMDLGSVAEVVAHGETGFVVRDLDEAVTALRRLGEIDRAACRRRAEAHYSAERMVEGYLEVYRRVLG